MIADDTGVYTRAMPVPAPSEGDKEAAGRPTVIYVMGAGRSGSTILGVVLGNSDGVFFAGELDRWLVRRGRPSCRRAQAESFWAGVLASMGDCGELFGGPTTSLERSSALLDPRRRRLRRRLREPYRQASERLYRVTSAAAGASHLVDTSHYPLRARELRRLPGVDLYLLYLVRDPRSVVASLGRRDVPERTFGPLRANAYLWLTHALAVPVFLSHPRQRRIVVRYEDFIARPEAVVGRILAGAGAAAQPRTRGELSTGAPFHGNRLIERESVALSGGDETPRRGRPLTVLAQLPWTLAARLLRPSAGRG